MLLLGAPREEIGTNENEKSKCGSSIDVVFLNARAHLRSSLAGGALEAMAASMLPKYPLSPIFTGIFASVI